MTTPAPPTPDPTLTPEPTPVPPAPVVEAPPAPVVIPPTVLSPADAVTAAVNKLLVPGQKTSEFIAMLAVWAGALATLLGAFNTHSPAVNGVLKIAAVIAAAGSHIGYALSRGDTKAALGNLASTLASFGVIAPVQSKKPANDAGAVDLVGLVAGVLVIAGLIWLVVGFAHHRLDVFGLVLLLVGIGIYLLFGGPWVGRWTRNRP